MKIVETTLSKDSCRDLYAAESEKIRGQFEDTRDGRAAAAARSALVDTVISRLYSELISALPGESRGFCLAALGGYGRGLLFPYSDVDLLFLSENEKAENSRRETLAAFSRTLWDLRLKLGQTTRTPAECGRLYRDNLEFNIALLDCRYLAGDAGLFQDLRDRILPGFLSRDGQDLVGNLVTTTERRHAKHGHTIFHLEPDIKEAPGGLRDYQAARWLVQITRQSPAQHTEIERAFDFLCAARCFLHYRRGRDDNQLTYELQEEAAGPALPAEDWMRRYFRHARAIHRSTTAMFDRAVEEARGRASLYGLYQDWRSRLSNADFSVVRNRIYVRRPGSLDDPGLLLGLFELVALHGLTLSREAETAVERALADAQPRSAGSALLLPGIWPRLRRILTLPHAAQALRAMHSLGLLSALFPEFAAIDCLVVRDFFHRYTVDEHSLLTIQTLHGLPSAESVWEKKFAEILSELERPELLFLALLLHDVGKGRPSQDKEHSHIQGSLEAAERIFARLGLDPGDRETIRFLISRHLEMSATLQRRDIFDPETVGALASTVGATERLKMLCLLTYADIKAVNPEALTSWKAEMLWRLYAATSGHLTRSVDTDRLPAAGMFQAGFPRRYQATHTPEEIAGHEEMARQLDRRPVQVRVEKRGHFYELTVLTADRPRLFASITGTLAAWGMSIVKADAFANAAGIVLDTFRFMDLYHTLELNPSELDRFQRELKGILEGRLPMKTRASVPPPAKVKIPTQVRFDDESSSHSTLLEIVAADRPGLLYEISSKLAEMDCNIEVALIDTEGQKAIDVFYLTRRGSKLDSQLQQQLREKLSE